MRKKSYHRATRGGNSLIIIIILLLAITSGTLLFTPAGETLLSLIPHKEVPSYPVSIILPSDKTLDTIPTFGKFTIAHQPIDIGVPDFEISAKYVYLVDIKTGDVLYDKSGDEKLYPASTTKIMTSLLMVENIKNMSKIITADADIITSFYGTNASNADIIPNEQISLFDLLHCVLLPSGNEASSIAARYISGSEEAFAELMTQRAHELGAINTNFTNSHGLHGDNHYTTAQDLSIIATAFLKRSTLQEISSLYTYTLPASDKRESRDIYSTIMMQNPNSEYYYEPIRGIKTGTTTEAGRCFVSTAIQGGRQLLLVVMDAPYRDTDGNILQGQNLAFVDTKNIYEWAFSQLQAQGKLN